MWENWLKNKGYIIIFTLGVILLSYKCTIVDGGKRKNKLKIAVSNEDLTTFYMKAKKRDRMG